VPLKKSEGESKNDFISRCIKHYRDKGREEQQSIAICESVWETMARNEYLKDTIARLRALKKRKK